jgi:hypothetical protein
MFIPTFQLLNQVTDLYEILYDIKPLGATPNSDVLIRHNQ